MKKLFTLLTMLIIGIGSSWGQIVTDHSSAGDPITYETYVASAGTGAKYAFMMPSDNSSTYHKWCGFRSEVSNEYTLSVNHLFILENGSTTGKYKLKSYSDGNYLAGNNSFTDTPLDLTLVNRRSGDYHNEYSNSYLHISFDNDAGDHYNNFYRDFRKGAGGYSTCIAYGPFYVVTVNCVDEADKTIRTVKYPVKDGATFTIAPNVGGYKAKANPNVTINGADTEVKVTYEDAFKPSANKGYKLKMKGTNLYVKFRISGYTEDATVNATILASEGTIFKLSTNEEGYILKWQKEYMKTAGSYGWNSGHGTDTSNSTWYIEAIDGEDDTYYIKKTSESSGSIFFGNVNQNAEGTNLYTDQSSGNIKWVLEETTYNDMMVEQGYWPETSTSDSPKYYTIKNTRCGKYAKYAGDAVMMGLESNRLKATANAFWFESVSVDGLAYDVLAVKIHNAGAGKCVAATNSFTNAGITWYLKADVYTGTTSVAINSNSTVWNNNSYGWNNYQNKNAQIAPYKSTDIGSAWWIEGLTDGDYSTMENIMPYVNNPGNGYYQISSDNASTLSGLINTASAGGITTEEYNAILEYMTIKKPSTGNYMMKSYYDKFMYINNGTIYGNNESIDAATIVRLERQGSTDTYKIAIQGAYLNTPTQSADVTYGSEGAVFTAVNTPNTVGKVAFKAGDGTYGSLHTSSSQSYRVVGWTVDAGASQWTIEDVTSVNISLTAANDNSGTAHTYATLCVPFEITALSGHDGEDNVKEVKAYAPTKSENYIVPGDGAETITAGTPVLLIGEEGATTVTATIGSDYASSPATTKVLTGTFTGTSIDCTAATGTNYVLGFDRENENRIGFYHVNSSSYNLKANRAYLHLEASGGARGFNIMFDIDNDDTGISSTLGETEEGTAIYNLSGQRLNKLQKGINIVNGKKVLF